jgi:hypothetical protein
MPAGLSNADKQQIVGDNAQRLLRIEAPVAG